MSRPSYEVIKRYRDKAIKRIAIDLRKDLVDLWKAEIAKDGISKAEFVRNAITEYLNQKGILNN